MPGTPNGTPVPSLSRPMIEAEIERLIGLLDATDGDPDLEDDGTGEPEYEDEGAQADDDDYPDYEDEPGFIRGGAERDLRPPVHINHNPE